MDPLFGALVSAGTKLLGGILGNNAAQENAQRNIQMQKEFAQNGISWKVADAQRAGIHPLAALGAPLVGFTPQQVGDTLGNSIADMGQDLSRAVTATSSENQRTKALSLKLAELQVQRAELENTKLASDIARASRPAVGPALPTEADALRALEGQGDSSLQKMAMKLDQMPGAAASIVRAGGMPIPVVPPQTSKGKTSIDAGSRWEANPYWSDAQSVEDRYGDAASWIYGMPAFAADVYWNAKGAVKHWHRRHSKHFNNSHAWDNYSP